MIYLGIVEHDRLVTMHTSIASGVVCWCKYQLSPALPQGARSLTEEDEEDDDKKKKKSRMRNICSSGNTKVSTSLEGIA